MSSLRNTMAKSRHVALVSLGSNQASIAGSAIETLSQAAKDLTKLSALPVSKSALYRTEPIGCAPGTDDFINAAIMLHTEIDDPLAMLDTLHDIESKYGRVRRDTVNAPRSLDLDLISFGGSSFEHPRLTVPHPRAAKRLFVLAPLFDIDPDLVLVDGGRPISMLIDQLPPGPSVIKIDSRGSW